MAGASAAERGIRADLIQVKMQEDLPMVRNPTPDGLTRRDFLKQVATAAVGLGLSEIAPLFVRTPVDAAPEALFGELDYSNINLRAAEAMYATQNTSNREINGKKYVHLPFGHEWAAAMGMGYLITGDPKYEAAARAQWQFVKSRFNPDKYSQWKHPDTNDDLWVDMDVEKLGTLSRVHLSRFAYDAYILYKMLGDESFLRDADRHVKAMIDHLTLPPDFSIGSLFRLPHENYTYMNTNTQANQDATMALTLRVLLDEPNSFLNTTTSRPSKYPNLTYHQVAEAIFRRELEKSLVNNDKDTFYRSITGGAWAMANKMQPDPMLQRYIRKFAEYLKANFLTNGLLENPNEGIDHNGKPYYGKSAELGFRMAVYFHAGMSTDDIILLRNYHFYKHRDNGPVDPTKIDPSYLKGHLRGLAYAWFAGVPEEILLGTDKLKAHHRSAPPHTP